MRPPNRASSTATRLRGLDKIRRNEEQDRDGNEYSGGAEQVHRHLPRSRPRTQTCAGDRAYERPKAEKRLHGPADRFSSEV